MPIEQVRRILELAAKPAATIEQIKPAVNEFFASLQGAAREDAIGGLRLLSQGIALPNDQMAAHIAMMCGALIEKGAPAEVVADALLGRLETTTPLARKFYDACLARMGPEKERSEGEFVAISKELAPTLPTEHAGWTMLEKLFPPAVAMFSADPSARQRGRSMLPDLSEMEPYSVGAHWLDRIIRVLHNEPYLAIEPSTRLGIMGKMSGISVNFQLHVLLMDLFPGAPARRVSEQAVTIARGPGPQKDKEIITGAWNLYTWQGLAPNGDLPDPKDRSSQDKWIWNEGTPADIPTLDGFRVILLGPAAYVRTWSSVRDFAALRADLTMEQRLSATEVKSWLDRIASHRRNSA